ncbi:MAG: phytanoyl-CoA dioxygenase family protein [Chloroflexota bacterium]
MTTNATQHHSPIFTITQPSTDQLAAFHKDGFIVFRDIFTEDALSEFLDELVTHPDIAEFIAMTDEERGQLRDPYQHLIRDWNNKGPRSDQLFDAPLVTALLQAIIGDGYHFCHSTLHVSLRGTKSLRFHQDHHHWFHENPINIAERNNNIAERNNWYIQMLYYPNGFRQGDRSLSVIPGSHRVAPTVEATAVTADQLLSGAYDEEAGRPLQIRHLELPPGSMVCLNARTFHGVAPKPLDSEQPYRIFVNYIFKQAGPPHRWTQAIPPEWLEGASPRRQMMFDRPHYTPGCWDSV